MSGSAPPIARGSTLILVPVGTLLGAMPVAIASLVIAASGINRWVVVERTVRPSCADILRGRAPVAIG